MQPENNVKENSLKAWVLNKLKRHRYIGGKHTDIVNISKGAPPKFHKQIDELVKELVRDGLILTKITSYGKHVSLNPNSLKTINEFIQKYYTDDIFK
jgi:hypothetical protein